MSFLFLNVLVRKCFRSHTHAHTHSTLYECAPPLSIFTPHLLMTLKSTEGKGPQGGACVSSTLALTVVSAATTTIPLIEEAIVDSTPRKNKSGFWLHVGECSWSDARAVRSVPPDREKPDSPLPADTGSAEPDQVSCTEIKLFEMLMVLFAISILC